MRGEWSFCDAVTGLFSGRTFSGPVRLLALNTPAGHIAVAGRHDHESRRVDVVALAAAGDEAKASDFVVGYAPPFDSPILKERRALNARSRIAALERAQNRPLRELAIDPTNAAAKQRLAEIDAQIAAVRPDAG